MSWGIEIYDDDGKPIKVTGTSFILDQFTADRDGSKTYANIPLGKRISVTAINIHQSILGTIVSINGNTVSWKCAVNSNVVIMVMIT